MEVEERSEASGGSFRSRMHELLRTSILDAAWERAARLDWADVRIADLAEEVGVSRQTIYNEFGAKDQLGAALFRRELEVFTSGVLSVTEAASDFRTAIRDSFAWMLTEARRHPILERMLETARRGGGESLLPVLTVRADVILVPLRSDLAAAYTERWPGTGLRRAELAADTLVRFGLSQVVLPTDFDEDVVLDLAVELAIAVLRTAPDEV